MSRLEDTLAALLPGTSARRARRPASLALRLAGVTVLLTGLEEPFHRLLARRFAGWTAEPAGGSAIRVALSWLPGGFRVPSLGRDEEYRLEEGELLLGRASVAEGVGGPAVRAAVAADPALAGQEVENVLRLAVAARLLQEGGLLLHAGAVALGDGALVFPAASGTGKSTLVRELAGAGFEPLGDDMAALCEGPEGWSVEPLPCTGEETLRGRPGPRPLRGVHPLSRGRGPVLEVLRGAEAAAAVGHQVLGLALFPALAERALATTARLAAAVPVERLRRSRNDTTPGLLRRRHGGRP